MNRLKRYVTFSESILDESFFSAMIKVWFVCLSFFLCSGDCWAQSKETSPFSIEGRIVDAKMKEALAGATLTLQTAAGVLITGVLSGENGNFQVEWMAKDPIQKDSLVLLCSYLGYASKSIRVPVTSSYHLGTILLDEEQQTLGEVEISARRPLLKFEKGAYLADVAGSSLSKLSSANDVLMRLPLLNGNHGSFTVRGRGQAVIFVNRREVRDPSEIQDIDASQIESIRIVTDPGAAYPIGTKAVIEITMRRWYKDHLGVTLESEGLQRNRLSQYHTVRTDYTSKRLSVKALIRMSDPKYDPKTDIDYNVARPEGDLSYQVKGTSKDSYRSYAMNTGLNYDLDDTQSVGFYVSASMSPHQTSTDNTVYRKNDVEIGNNDSRYGNKWHRAYGTLYYVGKLRGISINFQNYLYYTLRRNDQLLSLNNDDYFDMDGKKESFLYDSKLELGSKGLGGGDMTYGLQWTYTRRKDVSDVHEGDIASSHNLAIQKLLSPFFSYDWEYKKLFISAGMRVEWEKRHFPDQGDSDTDKWYFNPKVKVSYKFANGVGASLNWETYTSRPQYFVLSGISYMQYPFLYSTGNPHLKATQSNYFHVNISYQDLIVQLSADHIRNGVSVYYSFDNSTQFIKKTFENLPSYWQYGIVALYQIRPFSFWTVDLYGELSYKSLKFGNEPERNYFKKPSYSASISNRFNVWNGYTIKLNADYSRRLSGIEESLGTGGISGSVNKFFFGRKLYVSLGIGQYIQKRDIMRTALNNIRVKQLWDTSNKYVDLEVKYTFNAVSAKNKASFGNRDEIRRF